MESEEDFPPPGEEPGEDDEYGFEPFEQEGESLLGFDEPADSEPATQAEAPAAPARQQRGPGSAQASADSASADSASADSSARTPEPIAPPLALYRRYRPDTFAEVIGQEHVTDPLQRALVNNRVNHAYLFSGPRGCGKTTSARILARCLNCEQGPTPNPCGECQSCQDLARGGPGSIDVIEIDAASHGGVDDARDLRERAFFAPVHSRYKIYIVDEAHMVTTAGFNALLKLVEEPPPHVKFIFATTEPERVIGTIRSRTHHYPFRLVPPKVLQSYLGTLCEAEGIAVEQTVLPLVVRAGAGSVRDSLSVLDQLLGGAASTGVSYAQATALLGYTPDALLDEMLDAFAAGDSAGVFSCVDKVIEVGQDPRRFAEDLLRRLRDLVIVAAVPDALTSGLVDAAEDQADRLRTQAAGMGSGELTRAAEVIASGLTEMRGTTAPRLHLELMCARVLLPGADVDHRGVHARLDRLERRMGMVQHSGADHEGGARGSGHPSLGESEDAPVAPVLRLVPSAPGDEGSRRDGDRSGPAGATGPSSEAHSRPDQPQPVQGQSEQGQSEQGQQEQGQPDRGQPDPGQPAPSESDHQPVRSQSEHEPGQPARQRTADPRGGAPGGPAEGAAPGATQRTPPAEPDGPDQQTQTREQPGLNTAEVRRLWPEVLEEVKGRRRFTWVLVSQNAQVAEVRGNVLVLAMNNVGARDSFARGGNEDVLIDSLVEVLGADLKIELIVDGEPPPGRGGRDRGSQPPGPGSAGGAAPRPETGPSGPASPPDSGPPTDSVPPGPPAAGGSAYPVGDPSRAGPPADQAGSPGQAAEKAPTGQKHRPDEIAPETTPTPQVVAGETLTERDDERPADSSGIAPDAGGAGPSRGTSSTAPGAPQLGEGQRRARQGIRPTRHGGPPDRSAEPERDPYEDYDPNAPEDTSEFSQADLLAKHLGAELISEEESPR